LYGSMERAHETIEEHAHHSDPSARRVAMPVSVLAAVLALTEIGGKSSQNAYLTNHIALSDDWAFYQARNLRASVREIEIAMLSSQPNAQDTAVQTRIKEAEAYITRMRDDPKGVGMKQLAEKAHEQEAERDEAAHRYHNYEYAVGGLEIAIVLASVSVITRIKALTIGAAAVGGAAAAMSLGVATHLF